MVWELQNSASELPQQRSSGVADHKALTTTSLMTAAGAMTARLAGVANMGDGWYQELMAVYPIFSIPATWLRKRDWPLKVVRGQESPP